MDYSFADYLPLLFAPDPAGITAQAASGTYPVEVICAVQHSPITNWNPGTPYPGPPATVQVYVDYESQRWWGRTGQGQLNWSEQAGTISADLPPMLPQDLYQHIDTWQSYMAGYPSMARNRPSAFGDQVPQLFGGS